MIVVSAGIPVYTGSLSVKQLRAALSNPNPSPPNTGLNIKTNTSSHLSYQAKPLHSFWVKGLCMSQSKPFECCCCLRSRQTVEWVSVWAQYCQVLLWRWSREAWERQTDCLSFHGVLMPPAIFFLGSSEGHNVRNAQLWAFPSQINCLTTPEINELHRILRWNQNEVHFRS